MVVITSNEHCGRWSKVIRSWFSLWSGLFEYYTWNTILYSPTVWSLVTWNGPIRPLGVVIHQPTSNTYDRAQESWWGHYCGNICQVFTGWGSISNVPSAWLTIMLVLNIYKYIWPFSHSKGIIFFATFIEKFWLQSFLLEIWCCIAGNFLDPGKKGTTLSNFCWTSVTVRQSSDQPGVENGEMDHWRKTNSGGKSCLNNVWLRISALLYFI